MPIRRIMYNPGDNSGSTQLSARTIGNRKPVCANYGWCDYQPSKYQYQIPCTTDGDCVFYDADNKDSDGNLKLVKEQCIPFNEENNPNAFGNTEDTGCKDNPLEFHFSYTDSGSKTPKVQVLDNWGWCSGECKGGTYGAKGMENGGCYEDNDYGDCVPSNNITDFVNPWINYKGTIKINP